MLVLNLLGRIEVICENTEVTHAIHNKGLAILAYLSTGALAHPRERLSDLLWPSLSREAARSNLRKTVFRLRKTLGDVLWANADALQLAPDNLRTDTTEFVSAVSDCAPSEKCGGCLEKMEYSVNLYRAPFLDGLSVEESPDFEDWLCIKRETYHRIMVGKLERLIDCHQKNSHVSKALGFANRLLELEPMDEGGHRTLMHLLAQSGQKSAALAHYQALCSMLESELGARPQAQTIALFDQINGSDFPHDSTFGHGGAAISGELRQVTALYCSFEPADADDNEDAPVRWIAARHRVLGSIRESGGHITQMHGSAVLGYFGYPLAQEDSARRAVRAALALQDLEDCGVRISAGLHTGLTVTSADMPDVMGQTSNTAMHLKKMDRSIVISEATWRLVAGYFHAEPLEPQQTEDGLRRVQAFKVTGESGARHRLEAAHSLTPLVGRKAEVDRLASLWHESLQGKRNVVLIQGEAGIGKSRLIHALKERLDNRACIMRELRCFPEFSHSPLHPLIALIESLCRFQSGDPVHVKADKLARFLREHYPRAGHDALPLLARMLSLPCGESPNFPHAKEKLHALLIQLLQMLAARQPVLYVIEDLHWIDPSTLELLTAFINRQLDGSILMLLTARPEFDPPWREEREIFMELRPMDDAEMMDIVAYLGKDILPESIRHIVARADGIPLFAEEMAKMAQDGRTSIPASLRDLLDVKLDSMGEAKRTAQLAASIGREFELDLLGEISHQIPMLNALQEAGLVSSRGGNGGFQFRHALIQEAAYQSQTMADRKAAHRSIAEALHRRFTESGETLPEIVAQHLAAAGEAGRSAEYWLKAGQRSLLNSANSEAMAHVNCGLQQLQQLSPGREREGLETKLHLVLGAALIATQGFGSAKAGDAYSRALGLSEGIGDHEGLYQALWGMWLTSSSRIDHAHSLELASRLLQLARQSGNVLHLQQAHYAMGNSQFWTGHPDNARRHLEASMSLHQPSHHLMMVRQSGENVCLSSGSLLSLVLWLQGFPDQAIAVSTRTIALARELNHPFNLGYALSTSAMLHRWLGKVEAADKLAGECIDISDEFGLPFWRCMGEASAGWAAAMRGEPDGILRIRRCLEAIDAVMSGAKLLFLAPLCEALFHLRQFDDALTALNEAIGVAEEKNDRFFESELHRLKGECLLGISSSNHGEARACIKQALEISRVQNAKSLELRAAASLTRHFGESERPAEACSWLRQSE